MPYLPVRHLSDAVSDAARLPLCRAAGCSVGSHERLWAARVLVDHLVLSLVNETGPEPSLPGANRTQLGRLDAPPRP